MNMPKISFILPIYNVEKYLPLAIESIKRQTLSDWEAILVDDGSLDMCGVVCDRAREEDSRFKVIHKPNGGVSSAKNAGLDIATGEYVHFFDPDDFIEPCLAEEVCGLADENNADIVFFGLYREVRNEDGKLLSSVFCPPPVTGTQRGEPCKRLFDKIVTSHLMPAKLFRRSLIEKGSHRFPDRKLGEDGMFFANVYGESPECICGTDKAYYHYIKREGSASLSFHEDRLYDNFYLTKEIAKVVEKWGLMHSKKHMDSLEYSALRDLQLSVKNISYSGKGFFEQRSILKNIMKDSGLKKAIVHVPFSRVHGRNDKIKLMFLKLHLYSVVMLLSNLNK